MNDIIAVDWDNIIHTTEKGNGSKYCRERKLNLDWHNVNSPTGITLQGGVYFTCNECKISGMMKSSELTLKVKKEAGFMAHESVGIELPSCKAHIKEDVYEQ